MDKTLIDVTDKTVTMKIPVLQKNIDVERRIVAGWATIDNVDQMGDQVTAEASRRAFSEFRGNVREMHQDVAVGKIVKSEQRPVVVNGKQLTGVYVEAYISKGAENTWQKVLDGTLNAFSIKGPILPGGARQEYRKSLDKTIRVIELYKLHELSLVDNPGNELCSILSVQKSNDADKGIAEDLDIRTVYWCDADEVAVMSKKESERCYDCGELMKEAGWYEYTDDNAQENEVKKILQEFNHVEEDLTVTKGGPLMSQDKNKDAPEKEQVEEVVEASVVEEKVETPQEPSFEGIEKAIAEIKEALDHLNKGDKESVSTLTAVKESVEAVEKSVETRLDELKNQQEELSARFNDLKSGFDSVTKRLDSVESGEAVQKSLNVEKQAKQPVDRDNFWGSTILPSADSFDG